MYQGFRRSEKNLKKSVDKGTYPVIFYDRTKGTYPTNRHEEEDETMSKYEIAGPAKDCVMIRTKVETNKYGAWKYRYFAGYDFMGGAMWIDNFSFDKAIGLDEARDIVKDLEAADE